MKRVTHFVFVRHRHNWLQFLRFGAVGGSGVLVNQLVLIILKKLIDGDYRAVAFPIPFTAFNVRWFVVFTVVAFLVANTWNFQLNRTWTFKSGKHAGWWREFLPFLAVGSVALVVGQVIIQLLLWHGSPVELADLVPALDDSTGLRTALYWANLIQIVLTMPINFIVNKLWTFRAVRGRKARPTSELPMVAPVVAPEVVDEEGNPLPAGQDAAAEARPGPGDRTG
ncbi:GtrA family protein [Mariniluteicoccus flavus]